MSGAFSRCGLPCRSWQREPVVPDCRQGTKAQAAASPRQRCLGGWPIWTAAAARTIVQTQAAQPTRSAAVHSRSCAAAVVHNCNQQGCSARRCSLCTQRMHKLAVWAKHIMKTRPSDSEMCLNQTKGDIRSAVHLVSTDHMLGMGLGRVTRPTLVDIRRSPLNSAMGFRTLTF